MISSFLKSSNVSSGVERILALGGTNAHTTTFVLCHCHSSLFQSDRLNYFVERLTLPLR